MQKERRIAGRTLSEWDQAWQRLRGGLHIKHRELRHDVGLFRVLDHGQVVFLGYATQFGRGGLSKRLTQLSYRDRKAHPLSAAGRIYEARREVEIDVLILGTDWKAADLAKRLKRAYTRRSRPPWDHPRRFR
jgi:hypothetical protein